MKKIIIGIALAVALTVTPALADPIFIPVATPAELNEPLSGRLLVFATEVEPGAEPQEAIDTSAFAPARTSVTAREIESIGAGITTVIDGETSSFPHPFSSLPAGTYRFQAVLDRNHNYNYRGRGPGDMISSVVEAQLPGPVPALVLDHTIPEPDPAAPLERLSPEIRAALERVEEIDFTSQALSAFWGRPVAVRGWIALPPGYTPDGPTFPVIYTTGGFGSTFDYIRSRAANAVTKMDSGDWPPMIWVFLDHNLPSGVHEFADSVNNGPWGEALTTELIPWLETRYRMDARAEGRFLTGHSSGGWSSLWLQTRYPALFGGSWSTSPDASDFHEFTNIDLYAPTANAYRQADGTPIPLVRDQGQVVASVEQFSRMEAVLGPYGGQLASFEWVFSPRGSDGRPLPMFDRTSGAIDPDVTAYWRDNFDIVHRLQQHWPELRNDLDGKIHVIVGTADTFYLNLSVRRLQAALDELGARSSITYLPGRTHFDLFVQDDDPMGLMRDITREMYEIARPE